MFAQSTKTHLQGVLSAARILTVVGACMAGLAFAAIATNTIDPVAVVTDNGRQIVVTGPISCDGSQTAELRVTVTQRSTGALARGRALIGCTDDVQQWNVQASTQGKQTFEQGPATAVATATTSDRGDTDDAHQWLVDITLVGE